jgi:hypothetical protein
MKAMSTRMTPRATPKRRPRAWSTGPIAELATRPASSGVKIEKTRRATAKTMAKAARMPSSQEVPMMSLRTGTSRISGSTAGASRKAAIAAPTQPAIDSISRTRPRA